MRIHMTAQRGDIYKHQNQQHSIIRKCPGTKFNPTDYGIIPKSICTSCWDGYWCTYGLVNDRFCLKELYINSQNGRYPPINGVLPDSRRQWLGHAYIEYDGYHRYSLNMEIPYSGKILVGKRFLSKYYIHMGIQQPWAWEKLTELIFSDGKLIEVNDQSIIAAKIRERIQSGDDLEQISFRRRLGYVDASSLIDEEIDVWWI